MEQPKSGRPKSHVKTIGITGLSGVVLLLAGCYLYRLHSRSLPVSAKPVISVIHMEPFVVNLADGGTPAYLRIGIDIGTKRLATEGNSAVAPSVALIRDTALEVLTTRKSDDLITPDGKKALKEILLQKLQIRAPELHVYEIYFTEFLIQK